MTRETAAPDLDIEDTGALLDYLRRRGVITQQECPLVRNLEGGVSNRVVLVKPHSGESLVLKQALQKLRVQVDWFCTPTRVEREALALQYLGELAPPGTVPRLIFQDAEHHLLAMSEIPEPHQNWKQMLLAGEVVQDQVEQFGVLLGSIHKQSSHRKDDLAELFGDRTVFEALRLEPYYRFTASQLPESAPFLDRLIADTLGCRLSLVHGDYSPKNILVHQDRLVLLDYEVVHFGDPAFDLGFSMTHFLGKANHLQDRRPVFAEAALRYWLTYSGCISEETWVADLEPRAVRHTLGCCLARVAGRSPLEYLTPRERAVQASAVLEILKNVPLRVSDLIAEFVTRISCQPSSA